MTDFENHIACAQCGKKFGADTPISVAKIAHDEITSNGVTQIVHSIMITELVMGNECSRAAPQDSLTDFIARGIAAGFTQ